MFRKTMFVLSLIVILSLLGSGFVLAEGGLPTWETVFDPGDYMSAPYYLVHAVEEYKGDLYTVVGDPFWFNWEDPRILAGQVFRSPDGKDWEPASDLGFGLGASDDYDWCLQNYYDTSWDMTVFEDELYLLPFDSCYLRPGVILRSSDGQTWESVVTAEDLGISWGGNWYGQFHKFAVFNGMLYANMDYFDETKEFTASIVFRSPNGDPGTWEPAVNFPGWWAPGTFHTFKGALYLASDGVLTPPYWDPAPEQIWRTFDGVNWEMVVGDGFGNEVTDTFGGFADYKGYLYVGTGTWSGGPGQIWRSQDGLNWENVIDDGFGDPMNVKVDGLVVYAGDLYAYTYTDVNPVGGSVFRTKDAVNWEQVNEPGWGNPDFKTSHLSSAQVIFKDELYMGVIAPQGVLLKMLHPDK